MEMQTDHTILSRGLPKTGQSAEVFAGDDGTYQAGWWRGLTFATNRPRFTQRTIGIDVILIDNATGLIWVQDGNSAGGNGGVAVGWIPAIGVANALDFAGYTDWRLPNIMELFSILNFSTIGTGVYTEFTNISLANAYWTSSVLVEIGTREYAVDFLTRTVGAQDVLDNNCILCVRSGV